MTVSLSRKGQIVIPAKVRKEHRLEPGSRLEIIDLHDEIVLVPVSRNPWKAARGMLKGRGFTMKEFFNMKRAARRREETKQRRWFRGIPA